MKGGDRYNVGDYNIYEEDEGLEDIDFNYEMDNLDEDINGNNVVSTSESGPDTINMGMPTDMPTDMPNDMPNDMSTGMPTNTNMLSIDGFTGNFASV
jgi:hypothetical protein